MSDDILIDNEMDWRQQQIDDLKTQLSESRKECEEQARLNGIGSDREAALLARLSEANVEIEQLKLAIRCNEDYGNKVVDNLEAKLGKLEKVLLTAKRVINAPGERRIDVHSFVLLQELSEALAAAKEEGA